MLAVTELCLANVIPVPPTAEEIQGNWIGLPSEINDFCRLILTNGSGTFACSLEADKPVVYSVDSYRIDEEGKVAFQISPQSTNAYPLSITGKATHTKIRLLIKSPKGDGFPHTPVLYREAAIERMLEDLRALTAQPHQKGVKKENP